RKAQSALSSILIAASGAGSEVQQESCPLALQVELQLRTRVCLSRRPKKAGVRRLVSSRRETESPTSDMEAGAQHLRQRPGASHARAEARIVILAAPHLPQDRHHVIGAVRVVHREPLAKEVLHFMRKPQQHVTGPTR